MTKDNALNLAKLAIYKLIAASHATNPWHWRDARQDAVDASIAIDKALAEQRAQQEPCGWQFFQDGKWHNGMDVNDHRRHTEAAGVPVRDVYPSPQPAQQEQGVRGYAMALNEIALKLRERYKTDLLATPLWAEFEKARNKFASSIAAPQPAQRKPLTRDQVKKLITATGYDTASPQERTDFINGIRHAETAHGIKENT